MLGGILITLHNLRFFQRLMEEVREAIPRGRFADVRERFRSAD
jgi:tRNA-guanine family transglycosylase